jgi:anti-sigma regulatory factor (Ser/Thr protein kinase)
VPTPRTAERSFAPATSSVRDARRFLTTCLQRWDLEAAVWTCQLLLGELATNAVLHAGPSGFTVVVLGLPDGAVRLEVRDGSVRPPRLRDYGTSSTTGRGVALVAQLSRGWGVLPSGTGKVVWCEVVADGGGELDLPTLEDDALVDLDAFLLPEDDLPGPPHGGAGDVRGKAA